MNSQNLNDLFLKFFNSGQGEFDLKNLMLLEKRRLGFDENELVFVSAGDFSKFYWCPMQTYFTLKENEIDKFFGYLQDKIEYSFKLKKLNKIPKNNEELLNIGNDITLEDIMSLLERKEYQNESEKSEIDNAKLELSKSKLPTQRGTHFETIYAKKLPKIHWFVRYGDFIFTCEPDGIGDDYVYEFKSTKNKYFSTESILKAELQTDIYAICFNKKNKLIEQLIVSENKIESFNGVVDFEKVNMIIVEIRKIITGILPKPPEEKFKCRVCEYRTKCEIKN